MKRIIFGVSDLADVLFYHVTKQFNIDGFCVNQAYIDQNEHMGKPIFAFEELEKYFDVRELGIYVCIGYKSMNNMRKQVFRQMEERNIEILSFIHPSALVMTEDIGQGSLIFEHAVIGPYTQIGEGNIFYPKSMVCHHSIVGNFNFFAVSSSIAGNVQVGNHCFLGNNVTTKDGIIIQDYTLVGAGSYVSKNTKSGDCIVPARSTTLGNHRSLDFL